MSTPERETDYGAALGVHFAEDVSFDDAEPLLDAFARSPIFSVQARRVASSGPMSEAAAEVALILQVAVAVGAGAFAKKFFELLATDTYAGARAALRAIVKKIRERGPRHVRAASGLAIDVGIRFDFGPYFAEGELEWTEEELRTMLRAAQRFVDDTDISRLPIASWEDMNPFVARPRVVWDPKRLTWIVGEELQDFLKGKPRVSDG